MVSVSHPKPIDLKQESTRYVVAASKLLESLSFIICPVTWLSKEKR